MTFAERYCAKHRLLPEEYEKAVLTRSLYPQARLLGPLLSLFRAYFLSDREFVSGVGQISRLRDFDQEAFAYVGDPNNRGFLRQGLRLRVSVNRLYRVVHDTFREGSGRPFPRGR
ncbi:MAG TPA: hypothetical protein VGG34_00050 [Opitutaceae bacterium]|jgi:hypothetical protein